MSDKNLLDDLADAWDNVEDNDDAISDDEPQGDSESAPIELAADGPEDDDAGTPESPVVSEREEEDSGQEATAEQPADDVDAPPKSMSPAAREVWKDVPKEVKDEFAKFDQRMEGLAQKYGKNAERAEAMDRSLAPFQQMFAMNGGAEQTIVPVLQTASILQMGTPQQKAEMITNMIKQFGVDVRAVDSLLVGEQPQQPQGQDVQAMINSALAQRDAQQQQYYDQQQQATINSEVQQFAADPKNEFYVDVRDTMADLMEMAANRGQPLSMQDAYNRACQMDDSIRGIIAARSSSKDVERRRSAAVSISGSPGGEGDTAPPDSLRGAIEDAFANANRA